MSNASPDRHQQERDNVGPEASRDPDLKRGCIRDNLDYFQSCYEQGLFCDLTLECPDASVRCHRLILASALPAITDLLLHQDEATTLVFPDFKHSDLEPLVRSVYSNMSRSVSGTETSYQMDMALARALGLLEWDSNARKSKKTRRKRSTVVAENDFDEKRIKLEQDDPTWNRDSELQEDDQLYRYEQDPYSSPEKEVDYDLGDEKAANPVKNSPVPRRGRPKQAGSRRQLRMAKISSDPSGRSSSSKKAGTVPRLAEIRSDFDGEVKYDGPKILRLLKNAGTLKAVNICKIGPRVVSKFLESAYFLVVVGLGGPFFRARPFLWTSMSDLESDEHLPALIECLTSLYDLTESELFNQNKLTGTKWKVRCEEQSQMLASLDKEAFEHVMMENEDRIEVLEAKTKAEVKK